MNKSKNIQHFDKAYGENAPENYQRYFVPVIAAPLANDLIKIASLHPGERVLDVACGTGIVTFLAAEHVGATGSVAGVDLNPGMLAVARSLTPSGKSIEWYETTAETLPFSDDTFDVVFCQLSLQFIPDKSAALKEMFRVLTPGGRLFFNVPGPTPIFEVADEIFARHIGQEAVEFVKAVFSLHDQDEIQLLIKNAGFRIADVWSEMKTLHLPPPEEFLWQYMSSTPLATFMEVSNEEKLADLEHDIAVKWQPFVKDNALILEHNTVIGIGRK